MSEWKCRDCGAGVRRFDIQCRPCADKNSADLDAARRVALAAPDLLAACEALDRWATGLIIQGDVVPVVEAARLAIAKARGA